MAVLLLSSSSAALSRDKIDNGTATDTESPYFRLAGEADTAIAKGEYSLAESKLLEALRLEPGNPSNVLMMSNLGLVRFYMGRDDEALQTLNDACAAAPSSTTVLSNRARVLMSMGRPDEARADFARVLAVDSTLVTPRFYHGILSLRAGDIVTASTDFKRLEQADPKSFEANFAMATLNTALGNNLEAIPYFNRLIEIDPQAEYYAARALCNLQLDRLNEASEDISKGLELDSKDGELYLYRAMLNKMRFRPEDADADARKAMQHGVPRERVKPFLLK